MYGLCVPDVVLALGVQGWGGCGPVLQTLPVSRELTLIIQLTLIMQWNRRSSLPKEAQGQVIGSAWWDWRCLQKKKERAGAARTAEILPGEGSPPRQTVAYPRVLEVQPLPPAAASPRTCWKCTFLGLPQDLLSHSGKRVRVRMCCV